MTEANAKRLSFGTAGLGLENTPEAIFDVLWCCVLCAVVVMMRVVAGWRWSGGKLAEPYRQGIPELVAEQVITCLKSKKCMVDICMRSEV